MYFEGFNSGIEQNLRNEVIARKIYLSYPTFVFKDNCDLEFKILNDISNEFKIPLTSIQIAGSSKTGYSYVKDKDFIAGQSDLDVAIIDPWLFQKYSEIVMKESDGLKDQSKFGRTKEGNSRYQIYASNLAKGFFRPDCMPPCETRKKWFNFFNKLSEQYIDLFKDINAGIYFSQVFFEYKQGENIDFFKEKLL